MYFLAATLLIATAVDGARGEGYAYTPRGTPYAWLDGYDLRTDLNDDDGDGRLTWEEYVAGTHPKIADAFTIESISVQGGRVILRWPSSSTGAPDPYVVRGATNLHVAPGPWPIVGLSPRHPPTNISVAPAATSAFFRVEATYAYSPSVTLSLGGSPACEPAGMATVTASLSAPYYLPVAVSLSASGTAAYGSDYTLSGSTILIPAGHAAANVTLHVLDNLLPEAPEFALLQVADVVNAHIEAPQSVFAVIGSDDPEPPRVLVIKESTPADPQDFSFSGSFGVFSLDDDADDALPNARWFGPMGTGTFTVVETPLPGWDLTGIEVFDPDQGSGFDLQGQKAILDLDAGETIVVRFRNRKRGSIRVIKDAVPNDPQDFPFLGTVGALGAFSLDDDRDPALPHTRLFADLVPGTYTVTEQAVNGWRLAALEVADPDKGSTADLDTCTVTVDLDAGETIQILFVNGWSESNMPPTAAPGGPYAAAEGAAVTLDGSGSSDPDAALGDRIVRYEWDLNNDGVYETPAAPESNAVVQVSGVTLIALGLGDGPSEQTVALRVTDSHGATDTGTTTLTLANMAPVVTGLALTAAVSEGDAAMLSGTVVDPGADTFQLFLDWGDGHSGWIALGTLAPGVTFDPVTRAFTVAHTYADDGPSPGNATIRDLVLASGLVMDDDGGASPLVTGVGAQVANDDNDSGWGVTQQIQVGDPIGQTFTAVSGNRLATLACWVADMNAGVAPDDHAVEMALYEGAGTGGRLLGRRECILSDGFSGFIEADFSSITLAAGEVYTVALENDTPRWGRMACGNQYAGGTAWYAGAASPAADALFRVRWQADGAAPEVANDDNDSGWGVTQQIQVGDPIGQTFTAVSGNRLATIACAVADMNAGVAPDDHAVEMALYEGAGTGGRLLGRRACVLADGFSGFIEADFGGVTLAAGEVYTVALENDTPRWGRMACGNQYAGGTAWYAGAASPAADALFRVRWQADGAAPEVANDDNDSGWGVTQQIQVGDPIGQTFTAVSGNRLATIACAVADMNAGVAPDDHAVEMALYEGAGTGGRLLGRRACVLADGFSGFIEADFGGVTLAAGEVYTVALENDTPRWGRMACGNQYAGGTAWYAGAASPAADALFRVRWQADGAAPEVANDDNDSGWGVTQQIQVGDPIGQTFTAVSGNRLATIACAVADMNAGVAPDDHAVEMALYEGAGTGGRLLGRRACVLADGFSGFIEADFGGVTLAAGEVYTVALENDTPRWGRMACGNQYAGGTAWYAGAASPAADALFRVRWCPDAATLHSQVDNVAPVCEAGPDETLTGSWVFMRSIPFTDPGVIDGHTATVDYGDGRGPQSWTIPVGDRKFPLSCTYQQKGSYHVSVALADDDLGVALDGFTVTCQ